MFLIAYIITVYFYAGMIYLEISRSLRPIESNFECATSVWGALPCAGVEETTQLTLDWALPPWPSSTPFLITWAVKGVVPVLIVALVAVSVISSRFRRRRSNQVGSQFVTLQPCPTIQLHLWLGFFEHLHIFSDSRFDHVAHQLFLLSLFRSFDT